MIVKNDIRLVIPSKLPDSFAEVDKLQIAARRARRNVQPDQRAEAHAVHVGQIGQVEDNAFGSGE